MSPEQAEGRLDLLGPQSDVYSLGATFYILLTGRAPLNGTDAAEVLLKVQRGDFDRPRAVNANVPKPLEAICVKAMALKPADRYASPRALAEDIEHWLAGEPVSAYPEPWADRARRWARKHRTLVASATVFLVVGLMGSVGFGAVVTAKNRELARQTQRAEKREQMAIKAVERFRDAVVDESVLKNNPALGELRKKLLKEPLVFFQSLRAELEAENETRPEALARLAEAAHDYAHLTQEIGDIQDGLRSHVESLAIWEKLVRDHPAKTEYWDGLATIENCRGIMFSDTGNLDQALESYAKALAIWERLARESPGVIDFQSALALCHDNIGSLQSDTGHPEQARESYTKGLAIRERLARENPDVTVLQGLVAGSHHNIGELLSDTGHSEQALESYAKSLAIRGRLARENPSVIKFQSDVAKTHNNIAKVQCDTGHPDEALASYVKALAIQEHLSRENLSVTELQRDLAVSHHNIGGLQSEMGHQDQALESYAKALAILERLARENPGVTEFESNLAETHNSIGVLWGQTGHPDRALESYTKALAIRERLARANPESPDYASKVGGTLSNIADIDLDAKRFEQARDKLQQAISWQKKALAVNPGHPTYREFLRIHLGNMIAVAKGLGNDAEARAAQNERDELAANAPAKAALDQRLTAIIRGEAASDNRERLLLADRAYERRLYAVSTRLYSEALEADPKVAEGRQPQHRYNAACAAALAAATTTPPSSINKEKSVASAAKGIGLEETKRFPAAGNDDYANGRGALPLTGADRANLRNKARAWLEGELTTWTQLLDSAKTEQREAIAKTLGFWQQDTDLASVRDETALAKLPEGERKAWKSFWANVGVISGNARKPQGVGKAPRF
jgi:serine/threonine-protein kinase